MTNAIAGHGATIAMELDPTGSPGTFTTIAELNGDLNFPDLMRAEEEVTPHQDDIDSWVLGVMSRGPFTGSVNYIYDDQTHDETDGLIAAIVAGETRGFRFRGPNGSADTDEWIASGEVQQFGPIVHPVRSGARTAEFTLRFSGAMKINGTTIGAGA